MTRRLSTCGRCGGTIERRPGSVYGWGHVTETARNADGHRPDPDDSYAAGPGEGDRKPCTACHHVHTDPEVCEAEVSTGRYGSDGVLLTDWCPCTGPVPAGAGVVVPDPWLDPDAAAAHYGLPF